MKKAIIVLAGLAVLLVAALAGVVIWLLNVAESERNKSKTAAARAVRHVKPQGVYVEGSETLNQNANENQEMA